MRSVVPTALLAAVFAVAALADPREGPGKPCTPMLGDAAPNPPIRPWFQRNGAAVTVAPADLSRGGVALVLPEVSYEPARFVAKGGFTHQATAELVDALMKSPRFREAQDLKLHALSLGGMAYTFHATYTENGQEKRAVVKVFHPDRPFFQGDAKAGRGPEAIALMMQRQLGLYQYLQGAVAARKAAKPGFNVTVAKVDLDPALLRHGVFVQDFAEGQSGHTLDVMNGSGFDDFRDLLYRDQKVLTPAVREYFGNRTPAYADGKPRFLDEGNDWSNFFWVGKYRPPTYDELDVTHITLIDW